MNCRGFRWGLRCAAHTSWWCRVCWPSATCWCSVAPRERCFFPRKRGKVPKAEGGAAQPCGSTSESRAVELRDRLLVQHAAVALDHLRIQLRRGLRRALLGGEVDVVQAEALGEAQRPLQVVHQRPGVVTLQVHPGLDGPVQRLEDRKSTRLNSSH